MAGTLSDEILRVTGGPTVNDGLVAFYKARAATGTTLADLEASYLRARPGMTAGPVNDMWMSYFTTKSYAGTLNDQKLQWWIAGGPI